MMDRNDEKMQIIQIDDTLYSIVEFVDLYSITKNGLVYSHPRVWYSGCNYNRRCEHAGEWMSLNVTSKGYCFVHLYKDGKRKRKSIARLVAQTFILNPQNKPEVNHIDGNTSNNCVDNLEWVTRPENHIHRSRVLNKGRGITHNMVKITENIVNDIRDKYGSAKYTQQELADIYGLSRSHVTGIINRTYWSHI